MTCVRKCRQVAWPENHVRVPTSSIAASVRNACSKAVMSAFSKPAMYWSSNARARGSVGSLSSSRFGATSSRRARALCSALDRGHSRVEHRRDLVRWECEDLPQHEHGALPRGKMLQASD
jgi:hypothetical protein